MGQPTDNIMLSISHVVLTLSKARRKPNLRQIQTMLPPKWEAFEGILGQIFYCYTDDAGECTIQWTHPDPDFDISFGVNQEIRQSPLDYQALSYTWGSETAGTKLTNTISAKDNKSSAPPTLKIRENLALALHHIRYKDRPRTLWVDAVCINQLDKKERSEQVKRAALVYREAGGVFIWICFASHDSGHLTRNGPDVSGQMCG